MYSVKLIKTIFEDLKKITKADYVLCGADGQKIASTFEKQTYKQEILDSFALGLAESQNAEGHHYFKINNESEVFVLCVNAYGGDGYMLGRIAISELTHLMNMGDEESDRDDLYRGLVNGTLLPTDIERVAKKLKIKNGSFCVYKIDIDPEILPMAREMLINMYSEKNADYCISPDEESLVLIKAMESEALDAGDIAFQILSMANSELMTQVRISYGKIRQGLTEIRESYLEAQMAMEVAKIFFEERMVASYDSLGLGRIIYQLPESLCQIYMDETFGASDKKKLTSQEIEIIETFFECDLSIAEVARRLNLKRSTLVHRVEIIRKKIGLNIRCFDDAMTLKVAFMVSKYMDYKNRNM